jgi:hypothetical protein
MKQTKNGSEEEKGGDSRSQWIDARIEELSDWRGETSNISARDNHCPGG